MSTEESTHKYSYEWELKSTDFTKDKGKVFSCFACGGGSSMGYKMAGFDVVGCNEIDKDINKVYVRNLHPKYNYCEDIRLFKLRTDLPDELYNLTILDGSPPCSTFSLQGSREKSWGVEKKFKEGQSKQVLDTLFFDFIEVAAKLKHKIVVAENVKGILLGNAIKYVRKIYEDFNNAGYSVCHYLLDASTMGVPQKRERVFFIAIRNDLLQYIPTTPTLFELKPRLKFNFKEKPILFSDFADYKGEKCNLKSVIPMWEKRQYGDRDVADTRVRLGFSDTLWNYQYVYDDKVPYTLHSERKKYILFNKPIHYSDNEILKISTFPKDYDFLNQDVCYICGMSVPPVMMAHVATTIYEQWITKLSI